MYIITAFFFILVLINAVYNEKVDDIREDYEKSKESLNQMTTQVIVEEGKVEEVSMLKENVQKDKEVLEEGYANLKNENE